jgi:MFS family permease
MLSFLAKIMGLEELSEREPREALSVFFMLFMLVFLTADTMLIAPNVKLIMEEFGKSEAEIGLVSTVFIFFGAAVALIWGYFTDKQSRKLLVVFTIVLGEVPCLLTGYVRSYEGLLAVRVLTGLGIGGLMPLIFSMIGDLVSERGRSTAAAWIGLAEGLGMAIGMVMAGNLGGSSFTLLGASGWRLPFVLAALPNFVLAPLFWFMTIEPARGAGERAVARELEKGGEYTRRIKLRDYAVIFSNRTNIYFFMQAIPGTVGWGVLPYWIITFYANTKNVSIPMATNLSLLIGVGMIIGGFAGGIAGNWLHRKNKKYLPLLCGATTLMGFGFFLIMVHYPLPPQPAAVDMIGPLAVGIIGGFFITITSSNVRAIVLNVNPPENRGAMMSLFTLADSIGKGSGPLFGGLLIGAVGYTWTMDIATLSWIPCALVFLFLLTPQYPKDAAGLETLMEERAKEIQ